MNPQISIIVPVYNVEKYLDRCVKSLLIQSFSDFEIILVDDGSPDNCPKMCDSYSSQDSRVRVLHKENGGLSDARNKGLELSKGEYVFFVDSDDFIYPNALDYLYTLAKNHNADIVQCDRVIGTSEYFDFNPMSTTDKVSIFNNHSVFESPDYKVTIWAKLYKRSVWNGIVMPVGKLNEDDFTSWKVYFAASRIVFSNYKLYYNYRNPLGIISKLRKTPNIQYPIEAYHERISFFDSIEEKHLSDLSKWRYSLYLMPSIANSKLNKSQQNTLKQEFSIIKKDVLKCHSVPLSNKILIIICAYFPKIINIVYNIKKGIK